MNAPTCEDLGPELVAYLDGGLAEDARRPIAVHVSTCLTCRRELERLTATQRALDGLTRIEPSADFAATFWSRMADEPEAPEAPTRTPSPWRWAWPVLAAAAALALAVPFLRTAPDAPTTTHAPGKAVAQAPRPLAAQPKVAEAGPAKKKDAPALASLDDIRPEDLPPELLEHPELYLRLPVVRRLEPLEHFEAVQQEHDDADGAG